MKSIRLTQGMNAIVDDEDYDRVSAHKWYASLDSRGTKYYAKRRRKKSDDPSRWKSAKVRLHHYVLNVAPRELPDGFVVDHKNHDGLDCRKENLRIITQKENMESSIGWNKKKLDLLPNF